MARQRLKLAFIEDDAKRKATFKKRRKGLIKKADELSTLCGVDACAVIASEYTSQPEQWPNPPEVDRVVSRFRSLPAMEQNHKMFDNESFLKHRVEKGKGKMSKLANDVRIREADLLMNECLLEKGRLNHEMEEAEMDDLLASIERGIKFVDMKIQAHRVPPMLEGGSSQAAPGNVELQPLQQGNQDMVVAADEGMQRPQWVTDWMNAPDDQIGFGPANETIMPFNNDDATDDRSAWPAGFSPYRRV